MIIPYNPQFYKQNVSLFSQKWPTFLNRKKYETILPTHFILSNKSYWTGSPYYFYRTGTYANGTYMSSSGYFSDDPVPDTLGTRPVISLSSSVKLSGDGTWNNVYTVS